ncbi:MAG: trypsin-like serine protease [Alphaproteobacteria bacterium]|nr:trypsin-like serine protease [Alphaproteobacteria bacterium]
MIKKTAFLLLCLSVANNLFADTYTLDKRKYIDNATWATEPYSYVLKMQYKKGSAPICTANMIGERIVTAKHCIVNKDLSNVVFIAYNGRKISVNPNPTTGNYVENDPSTYTGDWAVLTPSAKDMDFVKKHSLDMFGDSVPAMSAFIQQVSYLGYGALKIMSDQEITKFQQAYYSYLYDNLQKKEFIDKENFVKVMTRTKPTIDMQTKTAKGFLKKMSDYGVDSNIFRDTPRLKESVCKTNKDPNATLSLTNLQCQSWGGNSGGGLYMVGKAKDVTGHIIPEARFDSFVGLHTRGYRKIGGKAHANRAGGLDVTVKNFQKYLVEH